MVSPLLTEVPGCFVAAAGVALIFQQRKLALRSFQAGLAAIISGAILLNIACVVMGAENAISFMPVVELAIGISVFCRAWTIGLAFFTGSAAVLVSLPLAYAIGRWLEERFASRGILLVAILVPVLAAFWMFAVLSELRSRLLATGRARGFARALVRALDWILGNEARARRDRRIGSPSPSRRKRNGRGYTWM